MGETGENINCPDCHTPHPKRVISTFNAAGTGNGSGNAGCGTCSSSSCGSCHH